MSAELEWPPYGSWSSDDGQPPLHSAGGSRLTPLPKGTQGRAVFGGPGGCYRYALDRLWDNTLPAVMFVMMNPSTADPMADDPTVAKCGRLARRWGYGRLLVGNTFAWRATDQRALADASDAVGPMTDTWLAKMSAEADKVVFAFGTPTVKALLPHGVKTVRTMVEAGADAYVLRLSASGRPWHPLYLPDAVLPVSWNLA